MAMMTTDNLLADPQAKTGAGNSLCTVEGLKDLGEGVPGHPGACISDRKDQSGPVAAVIPPRATAHEKTAAFRLHRIDGIDEQVIEHLPNFAVKAENRPVGSLA